MSFALDAFLIVICLFIIIVSTKRGFFKTLMSLGSKIVALICAFTFTPTLAAILKEKYFLEPIAGSIGSTVRSLAPVTNGQYDIAKLFGDMPKTLSTILERYNIDPNTVIKSAVGSSGDEAISTVSHAIAEPIVNVISTAVAFLGIFFVVTIVLTLITFVIGLFFELPMLKQANSLGGLVLGVIISAVIVLVYCPLVSTLVTAMGSISPDLFGAQVIDRTLIVKFVSEHDMVGIIKDFVANHYPA